MSVAPTAVGSATVHLQLQVAVESAVAFVTGVAGFAVVAAVVAGVAALVHRWYTRVAVPPGVTVLLGLAAVALYLNTTTALQQVIGGGGQRLFGVGDVLRNVVTFSVAALATPVGRAAGDHVATDLFAVTGGRELEGEVSRVVRSVGGVTAITVPERIDDVDAYDAVDAEVKETLAGKTLLFPGRLTATELRDRFVTRLRTDYGVGVVDVEFSDRGEIEYLALGSRVAGIGPTVAPGNAVVALRADPPQDASAGDVVQVWRRPPNPERVARGELRATAGDVATLVVDESAVDAFDPDEQYRLVTLPVSDRATGDREFASLLGSADETMAVVRIEPGSELDGAPVEDVETTVVAVRPAAGTVEAIPPRSRTLDAGVQVYVVGRPDAIRRLERRAAAPSE
jgi:hypothetical protein